ncbi:MAG: TrmH family RNA methyltransferase [Actinomycetota bacterium]
MTSIRNPRVQAARKLRRRAYRDRAGAFLVEGPDAIREALVSSATITELFVSEDAPEGPSLVALAAESGVPVWTGGRSVLAALSETRTPQGVVAVARLPDAAEIPADADLVVVLAGVSDPGNAGTLVRSAVAAGAGAVAFTQGSVDPFGPKTVRASAGALFHTAILRDVTLEEVTTDLRGRGLLIVGADARAEPIDRLDLTGPVAFVLGNEAWGLPEELSHGLDAVASIPMPGPTESLNVGVAGSILLFEAVRQRRGRLG